MQAIAAIYSAVEVEELGGGIRTAEDASGLDLGVSSVILGTVTPESRHSGGHPGGVPVGIGIDALHGKVAVQGWKEVTEKTAFELAHFYERCNPAFIVYTDISRDGMLTGPNIEATAALTREVKTPVVASGGVSCMDDIRALLTVKGLFGAIVGGRLRAEWTYEAVRLSQSRNRDMDREETLIEQDLREQGDHMDCIFCKIV